MSLLALAGDDTLPVASVALVASPFDFRQVRLIVAAARRREHHQRLPRHRALPRARRRAGAARQARLPAHVDRQVPDEAARDRRRTCTTATASRRSRRSTRSWTRCTPIPGARWASSTTASSASTSSPRGRSTSATTTARSASPTCACRCSSIAGSTDVLAPQPAVHHLAKLLPNAPQVRLETAPGGHLGVLTGPRRRAQHVGLDRRLLRRRPRGWPRGVSCASSPDATRRGLQRPTRRMLGRPARLTPRQAAGSAALLPSIADGLRERLLGRARSPRCLLVAACRPRRPAARSARTRIAANVVAGGVDLSGLTAAEATAKLKAELAPKLSAQASSSASPAGASRSTARRRRSSSNPLEDGRRGARRDRPAAGAAGRRRRARRERRRSSSRHAHIPVKAFADGVAASVYRPGRDATLTIGLRTHARCAARSSASASTRPRSPRRSTPCSTTRPPRGSSASASRKVYPAVNADDLRAPVPHRHHRRQGDLQAAPLQEPEAAQELPRSPSASRPTRRRPAASRSPNKQVDPVWSVPNSPWAGELGGTHRRRRLGREPAQGALDGHRQRRRHPRHRRGLVDRLAARRTAASGCTSRTSRTCTRGSPSARRS